MLEKERHQRIQDVSRSGLPYRDPALIAELKALPYPRYYLDFETIAYAVPRWPGTSPYEALGFQWSMHVEHTEGELDHREFLSTDDRDPRADFLGSLLEAVGTGGPVIVYSGYEQTCLKKLAVVFPDRADEIQSVIERLVDLCPMTRAGFYAASMKGSYSIKKLLPALAPELSYADLDEVANGEQAMEGFDRLIALPKHSEERVRLIKNMLACCRLDTYAMVAVLHRLIDPACDLPKEPAS